MALGFTPSFSYAITDNIKQLVITPDYTDYTDYHDLDALSVIISTLDNAISITEDLFADLVDATVNGTIVLSLGSRTVTGTTTTFLADFNIGDFISPGDDTTSLYKITAIASNTSMTIEKDPNSAVSGSAYIKYAKEKSLVPSDFGWSKIEDDIYTFSYTFNFSGGTATSGSLVERKAFVAVSEAYVLGKIKDIPAYVLAENCNCTYVDHVIRAWVMLEALKYSAYNGSTSYFTTIKDGIEALYEFDSFSSDNCNCN